MVNGMNKFYWFFTSFEIRSIFFPSLNDLLLEYNKHTRQKSAKLGERQRYWAFKWYITWEVSAKFSKVSSRGKWGEGRRRYITWHSGHKTTEWYIRWKLLAKDGIDFSQSLTIVPTGMYPPLNKFAQKYYVSIFLQKIKSETTA